MILMVNKLLRLFLQKTNQEEFRIQKVINRKGYENSFKSWIDKKRHFIK